MEEPWDCIVVGAGAAGLGAAGGTACGAVLISVALMRGLGPRFPKRIGIPNSWRPPCGSPTGSNSRESAFGPSAPRLAEPGERRASDGEAGGGRPVGAARVQLTHIDV